MRLTLSWLLILAAACGSDGKSSPIDSSTSSQAVRSIVVSIAGSGSGVITVPEASITCGASCTGEVEGGTRVTFTATADTGSTFIGWSGAECSGTAPCTVVVNADVNMVAELAQDSASDRCDAFSSADTMTIPGWTQRKGAWSIESQQLRNALPGGVYSNVITMDSSAQTDGCVRFTATYTGDASSPAAGAVLRWNTSAYVVAYVQDNNAAGSFNMIGFHEYPGEIALAGAAGGLALGRNPNVEVCASGPTITLRVDADRDGTYEVSRSTTTSVTTAGLVGVMTLSPSNVYQPRIDDFCTGL